METEKTPSETEILDQLRSGRVEFPPFQIEVGETMARTDDGMLDAIVLLRWGARSYRFAAECNRLSTPKALSQVAAQARRFARPPDLNPLVIVPYLAESRLEELQEQGVSGIDLCGNGIVSVPDQVLVYRTGQPNRFRSETEIKNAFRGTSSLVPRVFLVKGAYVSVQEARAEILERGGNLVLGTVSKVCKALEDLLLIERSRGKGSAARQLRLIQPDKLLDLLASNYVPPPTDRTLRGKTKLSPEALRDALARVGEKVIQTGFGSVGSYAVMAREPMQYFYTTDLAATRRALGDQFEETERFANVTFTATKDDTVYFDRRPGLVASPVQTYLELATGDKRSQETAEQVRRAILGPLEVGGK
jgi:hypothetical protein